MKASTSEYATLCPGEGTFVTRTVTVEEIISGEKAK